jgi:tRNA A-37 threonylcarbamoyl transferase component Bud32
MRRRGAVRTQMNREAALASLGLSGDEDAAAIARAYGQRLSVVHEQLVSAQTDAERIAQQAKLSELVEAYEFVTGSGIHTRASDDASATQMRSDADATVMADTVVRMEPGLVLGSRLEIGALLGQGGMGNVYAARDRLKNEDVAIKVLRQDLLFSTLAKERFLAEAKVSCSLSHPNIVRVHDVGVSGDYYYLSMERLKGHNLRQRIEAYRREKREFGVLEVADIARQLIDALRYAHRYIVHRDLKPENVWLAEDGTVKLMDFGIARAFSASQLTQTGMTLGTAYYMAPEQRIAAKDVDWRADQYALGVVLYELLAGTLPTGAVRPLRDLRRDLPKRYAEAVMRAMSSKPEDRFGSLNELLTEIEGPVRKNRAAAVVAIAAGVAAVAAGAVFVMNREANIAPAPATEVAATPENRSEPTAQESASPARATTEQPSAETASAESGETPPEEPPAADETPTAAESADTKIAAESPDAKVGAAETDASSAPPPQESRAAPAAPKATQPAPVADTSAGDARRQQCITQCERDEAECRSISRRSKQDCMRAVAFNAVASGRQQCEDQAHAADRGCMDSLRYCRASC